MDIHAWFDSHLFCRAGLSETCLFLYRIHRKRWGTQAFKKWLCLVILVLINRQSLRGLGVGKAAMVLQAL